MEILLPDELPLRKYAAVLISINTAVAMRTFKAICRNTALMAFFEHSSVPSPQDIVVKLRDSKILFRNMADF